MKARLTRIRAWYRRLPAWQADLLLGLLVAAEAAAELSATGGPAPDRRIGLALTLLLVAGILVRRRAPVTGAVLGVALIVGYGRLDERTTDVLGGPYLVALLLVFSMGIRSEGARLAAGSALVAGLAVLNIATDRFEQTGVDAIMLLLLLVAAPVTAGQLMRSRLELNRALRAKAAEAEARRARAAEQAVSEERERIAEELHDVVAHALGAMTVQASAARRLVGQDPDCARDAFRAIESTGREALSELRRLLGVLRRGDEELALAPQPRLAFVGDLVRRTRAAGLSTTLAVEGTPPPALPAGIDVTGYRIVQEALRAARDSARAGRAEVRIRYGDGDVAIDVVDDGGGGGRAGAMLGMRERVRVLGGELSAWPGEQGHRLRARLPLEADG